MALSNSKVEMFFVKLYRAVAEMRWQVLVSFGGMHVVTSWLLLTMVGEVALTSPIDFVYFYQTTATTVGYGDLSPATSLGKLATIFYVQPGGIALFTTLVAKAVASTAAVWRRNMEGRGDFSKLENVTILIGYHPSRTQKMIEQIFAGGQVNGQLVLVTKKEVRISDHRVKYIVAESYASDADLMRAGIKNAQKILVYADDDDQTLAAGLAVCALNTTAHIVAYFDEQHAANLLHKHTGVECVVSPSAEMVIRALQDPGASGVIAALVSATDDATIYSLPVPDGVEVEFGKVFRYLRDRHEATLVAAKRLGEDCADLTIGDDEELQSGSLLFFIAAHRLLEADVQWSEMGAKRVHHNLG